MAKHKVEVCVSNVDLGSGQVCQLVAEQFPDVRVKRWGCLGYCHRCVHVPYVLIDDKVYLEAETADELWEKVKRELSEIQAMES